MSEQRSGQSIRAQISGKKDLPKNNELSKNRNMADVTKPTSLSTLIIWNISKALEKNPAMDIKCAIKAAHARLDRERDVNAMLSDSLEQRHLACAMLAWQQLGHSDADSLCQFIEKKKTEQECDSLLSKDSATPVEVSVRSSQESKYSKGVHSMSYGSSSIGPVVKLPVETKIVMRMESSPSTRQTDKKPKTQDTNTMNKIEAACCMDSACAERLAKMDTATTELRMRAGMLARREAERVELLERAEAAWRDLELGYQRRLTLSEEKEQDLAKQIQKAIEERNGYKNACTTLATQLREKGDKAEKDRTALSLVEKEVCERACLRLKLSEESSQGDAVLAEHQCRAAQMDRDLQFKEEQARRKLLNFQSELESSQTITHETERAMRAELCALREQIAQVSEQLIQEEAENGRLRSELEDMRQEKMGMVEDLEGCKVTCDNRMQGKVDELKKKKDKLAELKDKVMECRCKLPVDESVEVKRTASLAALCQCTPEEKILESCSCTSLRSRLLSNLLGDLFSGLQAEMGGTGTQMPCQLLKCLEDKHNWDRASITKTNLKNYFAQLLIGELDIAIATSIEKYHAKWVGQSCADTARMIPDPGEAENEGWQERAIERRAQKLATKLAEQLFQERADELTQRARDIVSSGPPPCDCKPQSACGNEAAAFPVLVRPISPSAVAGPTTPANTPAYWRQTMQDVTQLRVQIEDLKKDSIKKEDLKLMEEKITKIVQRGSVTGKADIRGKPNVNSNAANDTTVKKELKINRVMNSIQPSYYVNLSKSISSKKKQIESNSFIKKGQKPNIIQNNESDKIFKPYKKLGQTYAINMCMCSQKDPSKIAQQNKMLNDAVIEEGKASCCRKTRSSKDLMPPLSSSVKQTKPINSSLQSRDISTRTNSKASEQHSCQSNCICFHKVPSNTSIDKLLETLAKWKSDLNPCENEKLCCEFLPGSKISELNKRNWAQNDSNTPMYCNKDTENKNKTFVRGSNITSLEAFQKAKNVPDIKEESVMKKSQSKLSSRLSASAEETTTQVTDTSPCCDKQSSIKTPKNASSKSYTFRKENEIPNSSKGDCCNEKIKPANKDTVLIPQTDSEYMGAINLDKSNEDFCKCVNTNGKTSNQPSKTFQCMPCKCSCKSLVTKKNEIKPYCGTKLSSNGTTQQNESKNMIRDALNNTSSKHLQSISGKIIKNTEIFPCDCGYDIQFLGVTLTDVSSQNQMRDLFDAKEEQVKEYCKMGCDSCNSIERKIQSSDCDVKMEIRPIISETTNGSNTKGETNVVNKNNTCEKCDIYKKNKKKANSNKESCQILPPCECKLNFEEFKNYIDVAFQSEQRNEDKGLDTQSFKDNKNEEESCVCCDKQNVDESNDLEENTFHLLEEHLKKKLEEFKENSCNSTCIPPEEEEKLFSTILKRVKQVITDSTNKISCKCSSDEENSQGSWNRAYGLLQEYLKTKIKRVQCSCVLAEDNNDTVLPDVLDKVCNLIEYDFQRLKDVCGCKKTELQVKDSKQVNFKDEVPERDIGFLDIQNNVANKTNNSCCSQNPQTSAIIKENISSQVPIYLGMETKSCNPLETFTKNVQTLEEAQESLKSLDTGTPDCNCCDNNIDAELLGKNKIEEKKSTEPSNKNSLSKIKPSQFANVPYVGYASECLCKDTECTNKSIPINDNFKILINNDVLKNPIPKKTDSKNRMLINNNKPILNSNFEEKKGGLLNQNKETDPLIKKQMCCMKIDKNMDAELLGVNEIKTNQLLESVNNNCKCNPCVSPPCCEKNKNNKTMHTKSENIAHFPNKPYIGFTIDCSCDTALGACVCTKSIFQDDNGVMDSIIKKSMPNDKYYEKVSYIMKSNPKENNNHYNSDLITEMTGDLYLHNILKHKTLFDDDTKLDCETEISFRDEEEDMLLKSSREYFEMAHTTTNTFDDNMSFNTDYSNTDAPLDWCECCSQMPPQVNSDQPRHSIYFPETLENLDDRFESSVKKHNAESVSKALPKYCDCDMVPICHVKMLVESIENKLVSAKCTCDSMIPKVCPIHSTRY